MKTLLLSLLFILPFTINAQIGFDTGSGELDASLNEINDDAKTNLDKFKTDISAEFNVSVKKIDQMFTIKMEPGEVFLALEISSISGKTIDDVLNVYKKDKDKGWGYIAKQMGIQPGSAAFHELKSKTKNKSNKGKSDSKGKSAKGNKGKGNSKSKGKK